MDTSETLAPDAPRPRLCHLRKWADFQGYGFNLHAEKGKPGQFIGKVDPESPAELAGLREGDRIVEVNGTNVSMENHQQVVERIKAIADETRFLVVDDLADTYYRDRKILVSSRMTNIEVIEASTRASRADGVFDRDSSNGVHQTASDGAMEIPRNGTLGSDLSHYRSLGERKGRLCRLVKWLDFPGYGFNLHAEKGKAGQYIGVIDPGSPAEAAGLCEGDRIVGVNGEDVIDKSHHDVVTLIKSDPQCVTLMVIDVATERSMNETGTKLSLQAIGSVETITCPKTNPNSTTTPAFIETSDTDTLSATGADESPPRVGHRPRLCHIRSWHDGKGFGFNMLAHKGRSGQYIGSIDPGSPAEAAGLRDGDRIVEVNGSNIENDDHKQVVEKIRAVSNETRLLVVDPATDAYYTNNGVKVTSSLESVQRITCPDRNPSLGGAITSENGAQAVTMVGQVAYNEDNSSVVDYEQIANEITQLAIAESANITPEIAEATPKVESIGVGDEAEDAKDAGGKIRSPSASSGASTPVSTAAATTTNIDAESPAAPSIVTPKTPVVIEGLEFAGSVEEARRRISKKKDVRSINMTIKAKYDLFQRL